jgi:predicted permease
MIFSSIQTVLVILLLILTGFFASWKGWLLKEHRPLLTKLIINISIPAVTIINFFDSFPRDIIFSSGKMLLMPLITMLISFILGNILSKILHIDRLRRGSFVSMCTVSNSIFIGLPVCLGLFGEVSIPYVMFYYIVNTIIFWSICSPLIRKDGEERAGNVMEFIKKIFTVPLITVLICMVLLLVDFKPPKLILNTAKYLGNMSTPLSLIFIGGIIYEIGLKNIKMDLSIVIIMMMRFLVAPLITFFTCKAVGLQEIATQVFTIQTAMPVMTQTVIVSEAYKMDSNYVATAISITTLASLFFIPFYMELMLNLL